MKLLIKKMGINGEGIGYFKRKPVFVEGAFPEETVDVEITETNERYFKAQVKKIVEPSPYRTYAKCPYEEKCGGCTLMKLDYSGQLKYKRELLKEAFQKYSELNPVIKDIIGADSAYGYRNKCSLPVVEKDGTLYNALYRAYSNKPVIIEKCIIHDQTVEKVRKEVLKVLNEQQYRAYDQKSRKGIRHLMVRSLGNQTQIVIVTGNDEISEEAQTRLMNIESVVSVYQGINTSKKAVNQIPERLKLLKGESDIAFEILGVKVRLLPQAFFQLNLEQTLKLYDLVNTLASDAEGTMIEAFCGVGVMGLMLTGSFKKVIGVEIIPEAVKNSRKMAQENNCDNIEFICGDVNKVISEITLNRHIDVLLVDPPRTGLEEETLEVINNSDIGKIIYVSCNPATLAKNIMALKKKYRVKEVYPLDMFPHTPHCESVTVLRRR